ncbi:myelin protein zero-like protein 2b isoform X4 [Astatotilapia calliptera]|uniref:myelin protein zero-like protein 2b isoform X4 n=1 Tax=Astatotilapia calliptera TaxID=8154 RepID=UPI000E42ADFF|nr:myelin protein zero-like protein 2 isoform X4 [Astatotilapia calliptera]
MYRILPLLLLGGFFLTGRTWHTGVRHVTGIEIRTEKEMEAVNGTDVKLSCTFSSTHPVTPGSVTVSWYFQPLNSKPGESLFYYENETPHPPTSPQFKGHVVWSGDIMRKDASITLQDVNPTFNGTYSCQVRNPPDFQGNIGEINLRVINKVSLSEISFLAIIVGGACGVILLILTIIMAVKFYKKKRREDDFELHEHDFKDPTVCFGR